MAVTAWLEKEGNILIMDDLAKNRVLLQNVLAGYTFFEAENANQAFKILERENIDVALLDVMLSETSGYEVCKVIKSHDLWRATQVIMVTSLNDVDSRVQALAAGADDFISRPFHIHELQARVKTSLRTKQYYDQMESLDNILFMLASVVENKDRYTEEHLRRMANYAEILAQLVDVPPRQQSIIRYGATLHDIGKIGVPDSILGKPSKLTAEEFEIMKTHTIIGAEIVKTMRVGKELSLIVRGHHERWDGKGYPDGMAGEEIPLGARIICICDVYDAMTSTRAYQPARSREEALRELQAKAGSQFDPILADIFLKNISLIVGDESLKG